MKIIRVEVYDVIRTRSNSGIIAGYERPNKVMSEVSDISSSDLRARSPAMLNMEVIVEYGKMR
jgi:hypothetical protein